jgi:hypothetical protein
VTEPTLDDLLVETTAALPWVHPDSAIASEWARVEDAEMGRCGAVCPDCHTPAEHCPAMDERGRARSVAVALEQQAAAVLAIHREASTGSVCVACWPDHDAWPCATARALGVE